jgi:hypothetical protein
LQCNGDGEDGGQTPAERMQSLLERSIDQTPDQGGRSLAEMLVRELVVRGPQDDSLHDHYEILLADPALIRARRESTAGLRSPRVVRATLRISELGQTVRSRSSSG